MRLQDEPNGCGAAALCNALQAVGQSLSLEAAAKLAGTSNEGTSAAGLLKALKTLGYHASTVLTESPDGAWAALCGNLLMGLPVILCVAHEDHWVTAIGLLGGLVLIAAPADAGVVSTYTRAGVLAWWSSGGRKPTYFGISLEKH